ncbi:MAG: HNH endonuclease domain-containing protein [bacterium]|nr:HNH endonuclease domain-containing protein [bacterium]
MKKILGLDIGTTSIGWAIIEATDEKKVNEITGYTSETDINNNRIGIYKDAVGVRIIAQDTERFDRGLTLNDSKGTTLTPTASRRVKRGVRRMNNRYKLRRDKLTKVLSSIGLEPDKNYYTNEIGKRGENNDIGKAIYQLRYKAIKEEISLAEMGRILMQLNQLRGYSSDRFKKDEGEATKKGDKEIFTSTVLSSEGPITHDQKYHRFKITFEDGNIGWEIRKIENVESIFKVNNELCSYSFKEKNEAIDGSFQIEKEKEVDKNSYAYRKKEVNDSIKDFIDVTNGTVGSFFYQKVYVEKSKDRVRNNHVNRDWYEDEFNKIWDIQFEKHKSHFEKINIEDIVKIAFKDYSAILNEVLKKAGIKEQLKYLIKDKIIYFQRPWQQSKNKGQCEFEKIKIKKEITIKGTGTKELVEEYIGRSVIPRSHPLFQEFKIWQQINNVRIYLNTPDEKVDLFNNNDEFRKHITKSIEEVKELLYKTLQKSKTPSWRTFVKETLDVKFLLDEDKDLKKGYYQFTNEETGEVQNAFFTVNFRKQKKDKTYEDIKLKGNTTKVALQNILTDKSEDWFLTIHSEKQNISNLQLLWEIIYDITNSDANKVAEIINKHFDFDKEICIKLANIKFDDSGMAKLSAKAIKQLIPLMSNGSNLTEKATKKITSLIKLNNSEDEKTKDKDDKLESLKNIISDKKARLKLSGYALKSDYKYLNYWEAAAVIYGTHSSKFTSKKDYISRVKPHSMNNPIVEKIVNETISIVNEIRKVYGFDEVRIELSRELKASMQERQQMWEAMNNGYEKNEWAKQMLREIKSGNPGLDAETSTRSNLDKIKIIEDVVKFQNQDEYKKKQKEYKLDEPSKAEIKKYLMWLEQNFKCPYTNQPIPLSDVFARGKVVEIEHIIPRERYYLNSYVNKVITWAEVNQTKANHGNRTAYEFIVSNRQEETITLKDNRVLYKVTPEAWKEHVEKMFPKGGKRINLLRKEIPEDPINRTLNETQYINKKLKEKLAELVGESKVWITSGAVTDILRERWHLNGVMKELLRNRYENFEMPTGKKVFQLATIEEQELFLNEMKMVLDSEENFVIYKKQIGKKLFEFKTLEEISAICEDLEKVILANKKEGAKKLIPYKYASSEDAYETKSLTYFTTHLNTKTQKEEDVEIFAGYSKRVDHRHHALDAIIIACTKQNHIQYINTLNAINTADVENENSKKLKYKAIKDDVCLENSSKNFITPWSKDRFIVDVKNCLSDVAISHKNTRLLISPSKHRLGKDIKQTQLASIRGELHKETNYAKKNYFEGGKTPITKLIPEILKQKKENQYQTMVHFKDFKEIICENVLKEKYQNILIPIFESYDSEKLNDPLCKEISKKILFEIGSRKLFINSTTNEPLDWLSTYSSKDKSVRPNGHLMNLNDAKEIKSIADPRIKRLANYRLVFVNNKKSEIDKLELGVPDKNKLKREAEAMPLYSNAIYEVRLKRSANKFEWVEIKDLSQNDLENIEYTKPKNTAAIKNKLKSVDFESFKRSYFITPLFVSNIPILVKKVRQISYFQDLYEVTKGRYVYSSDVFMAYLFIENGAEKLTAKRETKFLKFIDAVSIINDEKPNFIDYKNLISKEKSNTEIQSGIDSELLFTLAKNDLVYLPDSLLSKDQIEDINWMDRNSILPKLYIVKDMNPSQDKIVFQQFHKSDSITVSESDAKSLFNNSELQGQKEEVKYGTVPMLQYCIKVFIDNLGKKIVPYWEFENGCWNKEKAKEMGLF